jgi:hypothetical protein
MSETQMLLVAGYADVDVATAEFHALAETVRDKGLESQGIILVGKGPDGAPRLMDTGNHLGRRGRHRSSVPAALAHRAAG